MFTYAIGKALSLEKNQELFIDNSWVQKMDKAQKVNLSALQYFDEEVLTRKKIDIYRLADISIFRKIITLCNKLNFSIFKGVIDEEFFQYDDRILKSKSSSLYLRSGYWQSYRYFDKYQDSIRKSFSFKKEVCLQNKVMAEKIMKSDNSVSVHVRRGDYNTNPELKNLYGEICTLDYYLKSIDYISKNVKKAKFYIFSDDILWVMGEFSGLDAHIEYVQENHETSVVEIGHKNNGYSDMYLMTLCKHNIIANSSFSWWGAWLNKNSDKIVIAPKQWFNDGRDTRDLIPESWLRF